jgi:hypothetical protein
LRPSTAPMFFEKDKRLTSNPEVRASDYQASSTCGVSS